MNVDSLMIIIASGGVLMLFLWWLINNVRRDIKELKIEKK